MEGFPLAPTGTTPVSNIRALVSLQRWSFWQRLEQYFGLDVYSPHDAQIRSILRIIHFMR